VQVGLTTPLVAALGARTGKRLADKLGLQTVGDLLRHYPRRYTEQGKLTDLSSLHEGEKVTILGRVQKITDRRPKYSSKVRLITEVVVTDGRSEINCTFFNQFRIGKELKPGTEAVFAGTISRFRKDLQISSPRWEALQGSAPTEMLDAIESFGGGNQPLYPLTEGITQVILQRSIRTVLTLLDDMPDPVPIELLARHGLTDLDSALRDVHRPRSQRDLDRALRRLRYDEALSIQLVLARRRAAAKEFPAEPCPRITGGLLEAFERNLPFALTTGQKAVGAQITTDLSTIHPMNRLLQGEVGSGKTVVALRAMLQVIDAGRQAVLLAPTEVLAGQHVRSLRDTLGPLGHGGELGAPPEATKITLLTGSLSASARREALLDIASGQAGITVGTHALLSDDVFFAGLGLIVVDEQHRFGVEQRDTLRTKHPAGNPPHVLVMTATPIPRTVAMTVYGDLDTSTLTELPRGRSPISTTLVPVAEKPAWLDRVWQRLREEVAAGHQAFVVCPKIGDDERGGADDGVELTDDDGDEETKRPPLSVLQVAGQLSEGPLRDVRVAVLHGRLPAADKDGIMRRFAAGEIDVLVATTVIEVGVDVPNATAMVIMDAERFGMSQLHQLRGRVGRGRAPGVCLLVTEADQAAPGIARLRAVERTSDGFELAEADLQLRREGDVLGTSQAGRSSTLRQLSLLRDRELIEEARDDAQQLITTDPALAGFPGLADMLAAVIAEESQGYLEKG
jgi:ATP-dependent DNA helicase RecG